MVRIHTTALMRVALLPVALLMAIGGSVMAFASGAGPVAGATSGAGPVAGATSGAPAAASQSYYTMQLSSPSATVRAGRVTRTAVSFRAPDDLYGTPVNLSV